MKWIIVAVPLLFLGGCVATWKLSPSFQEKVFLLGLGSGISPIQKLSAEKLRDYPTKMAAITLVVFANLHNPYRLESKEWKALEQKKSEILNEIVRSPEKRTELEAQR